MSVLKNMIEVLRLFRKSTLWFLFHKIRGHRIESQEYNHELFMKCANCDEWY